jgi:type IV pilus biogenesis protein PilP
MDGMAKNVIRALMLSLMMLPLAVYAQEEIPTSLMALDAYTTQIKLLEKEKQILGLQNDVMAENLKREELKIRQKLIHQNSLSPGQGADGMHPSNPAQQGMAASPGNGKGRDPLASMPRVLSIRGFKNGLRAELRYPEGYTLLVAKGDTLADGKIRVVDVSPKGVLVADADGKNRRNIVFDAELAEKKTSSGSLSNGGLPPEMPMEGLN